MTPQESGRRRLPIANQTTARAVGAAGVLACVLCCVSIPGTIALISAIGLGLLRNIAAYTGAGVLVGVALWYWRRRKRCA